MNLLIIPHNIGVLYAQSNDKDQARHHWEYIVNNEQKLKRFESYYKERESAIGNLEIAKKSEVKKSGCFIATACYGDIEATEVNILRAFRDKVLVGNLAGKLFCRAYYRLSPPIAEMLLKRRKVAYFLRKHFFDWLVRKADAYFKRRGGN